MRQQQEKVPVHQKVRRDGAATRQAAAAALGARLAAEVGAAPSRWHSAALRSMPSAAVSALQRVAGNRAVAAVIPTRRVPAPELPIQRDTVDAKDGVTYVTKTFDTNKERPTTVVGPVRSVSTAGRGATAVPVSGALPLGYDGGHVLGLNLGGANIGANVVPMYPRFNRGVWRNLEVQLAGSACFIYSGRNLLITITVGYPDDTTAIPDSLTVTGTYDGPTTGKGAGAKPVRKSVPFGTLPFVTLHQPTDIPRTGQLTRKDENTVTGVTGQSEAIRKAADHLENVEGDKAAAEHLRLTKHLPPAARASYPDRPEDRPYEYLDIVTYAGIRDTGTSFVDGAVFSAAQRTLLLQTNMARHGGRIVSDDPDDPVHNPPHNRRALDERGTVEAPEIDHIIPRSSGGSNRFSNARVVSWLLNNREDRIKNITGLVDTRRLAPPAFPTSGTLQEKVQEFLPRYLPRLTLPFKLTQGDDVTVINLRTIMERDYTLRWSTGLRSAFATALADLVGSGDITKDLDGSYRVT